MTPPLSRPSHDTDFDSTSFSDPDLDNNPERDDARMSRASSTSTLRHQSLTFNVHAASLDPKRSSSMTNAAHQKLIPLLTEEVKLKFNPIRFFGSSGQASVFAGEEKRRGPGKKVFAIKAFLPNYITEGENETDFLYCATQYHNAKPHETASNRMTQIIQMCKDLGEDGITRVNIVLPYYQGGDLGDLLARSRKAQWPEALLWHCYRQMVEAVEWIHSGAEKAGGLSMIHRDIKIENWICDMTGPLSTFGMPNLRLADFGMAIWETDWDDKSRSGWCGTDAWWPPEGLRWSKSPPGTLSTNGKACDVWAVGAIIQAIATGWNPNYTLSEAENANRFEHSWLVPSSHKARVSLTEVGNINKRMEEGQPLFPYSKQLDIVVDRAMEATESYRIKATALLALIKEQRKKITWSLPLEYPTWLSWKDEHSDFPALPFQFMLCPCCCTRQYSLCELGSSYTLPLIYYPVSRPVSDRVDYDPDNPDDVHLLRGFDLPPILNMERC